MAIDIPLATENLEKGDGCTLYMQILNLNFEERLAVERQVRDYYNQNKTKPSIDLRFIETVEDGKPKMAIEHDPSGFFNKEMIFQDDGQVRCRDRYIRYRPR